MKGSKICGVCVGLSGLNLNYFEINRNFPRSQPHKCEKKENSEFGLKYKAYKFDLIDLQLCAKECVCENKVDKISRTSIICVRVCGKNV